jgi:osmoprotectant transport system ATP-binding protein
VARALAADPPVMLMDEPFSAVDPVVREQLQDEFLRLQSELGKTILFVTHDIDEAVKLGDRVAVLRVGGELAQLAEPAKLLADPFDDFVADFVGRDRGYRSLGFRAAPSLTPTEEPTVPMGARAEEVRRVGGGWVLVVDGDRRPIGWVEPAEVHGTVQRDRLHRGGTVARLDGSTRAVLDAALSSPSGRGVVVDGEGRLLGTVTAAEVVAALERR